MKMTSFLKMYGHVLRLAAILLLIPLDTSECERIFSLMNNIKTKDRTRLMQANLRNLMLWHYHGKKFTLQNLPWLDQSLRNLSS